MSILNKSKLSGAILFLITSTSALSAVTVRDIGVFGLYSHDLFQWDRKNEVSLENGRLDLSTIFDYDNGKRWKKGGNPKNGENAPVYSVTMDLVKAHKAFMAEAEGTNSEKFSIARKKTVALFKEMVEKSFLKQQASNFRKQASMPMWLTKNRQRCDVCMIFFRGTSNFTIDFLESRLK